MERLIDKELKQWKDKKDRKVLLLRGARQVGKTYSIRKLSQCFKKLLEINFEETPAACRFFKNSLTPREICEKLSVYFNTTITPGESLVFFDEIQACPRALRALRFFYEKMPDLHVAAAGSLLELALSEISSFGVGRIHSLFMFPMTFAEYLHASGNDMLNSVISSASFHQPVDPVIHEKILDKIKIFLIIGGMPKVVDTYINKQDFHACQLEIDNIINSLIDDFAKYKEKVPSLRLEETFYSTAQQAGNKFVYSKVGEGIESSKLYKEALELLVKAGIAYKVYHTSARGIPLGAQINRKRFKVIPYDTGIYQRLLGLDLSRYILDDFPSLVNRGSLAEIYVGLELLANRPPHMRPEIFYWHREARISNAEVDYVKAIGSRIFPIEVKAGTRGQMQSLHLFLNERNLDCGLRISHENFSQYDKIKTIPIYAVKRIEQLGGTL
jgi:predicted AAA+ superfamily ATPase